MYENFISIDNGQLTMDNYLTSSYGGILNRRFMVIVMLKIENYLGE